MATHPLPGSSKTLLPGAQVVGNTDPDERLEVSVRLRRRDQAGFESHLTAVTGGGRPISREEYAERFGEVRVILADHQTEFFLRRGVVGHRAGALS